MTTTFAVIEQLYIEPDGAAGMDWQTRAACRGADLDRFFSEGRTKAEVVAVCEDCPVLAECRAYALDREWVEGVWGGTTKKERARIRAAASAPRIPEACGRGHRLTPEVLYVAPDGAWRCRECARIAREARRTA